MKILAAAAAACLFGLALLVSHQPNISYDDGFETECRSILFPGVDGSVHTPSGGRITTSVVRGKEAFDQLVDDIDDGKEGQVGSFYVRDQLDADCTDRRAQLMLWAQLLGMLAVLSASAAFTLHLRGPRERPAAYVPPPGAP